MTFASRLDSLIQSVTSGNVAEFVRKCKSINEDSAPSDTMVRKYLAGGSPTLERFVVMAQAGDVSLNWLAGLEERGGDTEVSESETTTSGADANGVPGDAGAEETFYLIVDINGSFLRAPLGEFKPDSDIKLKAKDAFIGSNK